MVINQNIPVDPNIQGQQNSAMQAGMQNFGGGPMQVGQQPQAQAQEGNLNPNFQQNANFGGAGDIGFNMQNMGGVGRAPPPAINNFQPNQQNSGPGAQALANFQNQQGGMQNFGGGPMQGGQQPNVNQGNVNSNNYIDNMQGGDFPVQNPGGGPLPGGQQSFGQGNSNFQSNQNLNYSNCGNKNSMKGKGGSNNYMQNLGAGNFQSQGRQQPQGQPGTSSYNQNAYQGNFGNNVKGGTGSKSNNNMQNAGAPAMIGNNLSNQQNSGPQAMNQFGNNRASGTNSGGVNVHQGNKIYNQNSGAPLAPSLTRNRVSENINNIQALQHHGVMQSMASASDGQFRPKLSYLIRQSQQQPQQQHQQSSGAGSASGVPMPLRPLGFQFLGESRNAAQSQLDRVLTQQEREILASVQNRTSNPGDEAVWRSSHTQGKRRNDEDVTQPPAKLELDNGNHVYMTSIFDGHSGRDVPEALRQDLPGHVAAALNDTIKQVPTLLSDVGEQQAWLLSEAISFAFIAQQEQIRNNANLTGGSTAVVGIWNEEFVFLANVGDAVGYFAGQATANAAANSKFEKATANDDADSMKELCNQTGMKITPHGRILNAASVEKMERRARRNNQQIKYKEGEPHVIEEHYNHLPNSGLGTLNAFGDKEWGFISRPRCLYFQRDELRVNLVASIVLACDGAEEPERFLKQRVRDILTLNQRNPTTLTENIIRASITGGSCDNITALSFDLNTNQNQNLQQHNQNQNQGQGQNQNLLQQHNPNLNLQQLPQQIFATPAAASYSTNYGFTSAFDTVEATFQLSNQARRPIWQYGATTTYAISDLARPSIRAPPFPGSGGGVPLGYAYRRESSGNQFAPAAEELLFQSSLFPTSNGSASGMETAIPILPKGQVRMQLTVVELAIILDKARFSNGQLVIEGRELFGKRIPYLHEEQLPERFIHFVHNPQLVLPPGQKPADTRSDSSTDAEDADEDVSEEERESDSEDEEFSDENCQSGDEGTTQVGGTGVDQDGDTSMEGSFLEESDLDQSVDLGLGFERLQLGTGSSSSGVSAGAGLGSRSEVSNEDKQYGKQNPDRERDQNNNYGPPTTTLTSTQKTDTKKKKSKKSRHMAIRVKDVVGGVEGGLGFNQQDRRIRISLKARHALESGNIENVAHLHRAALNNLKSVEVKARQNLVISKSKKVKNVVELIVTMLPKALEQRENKFNQRRIKLQLQDGGCVRINLSTLKLLKDPQEGQDIAQLKDIQKYYQLGKLPKMKTGKQNKSKLRLETAEAIIHFVRERWPNVAISNAFSS